VEKMNFELFRSEDEIVGSSEGGAISSEKEVKRCKTVCPLLIFIACDLATLFFYFIAYLPIPFFLTFYFFCTRCYIIICLVTF